MDEPAEQIGDYADNVARYLARRRARWVSAFSGSGVLACTAVYLVVFGANPAVPWFPVAVAVLGVAEVVWGLIALAWDRTAALPDGRHPPEQWLAGSLNRSVGSTVASSTAVVLVLWGVSLLPSDGSSDTWGMGMPLLTAFLSSLANAIPPIVLRSNRDRVLTEYLAGHPHDAIIIEQRDAPEL